jgi:hypothetical protein
MNYQPLHIVNSNSLFAKISTIGFLFLACLSGFVDLRMGLYEWMAWMWFGHDHTPSIHNASMTWHLEILFIILT